MESLPPASEIQKGHRGPLRRILAVGAMVLGLLLAGILANKYQEWQNSRSNNDSFKIISE